MILKYFELNKLNFEITNFLLFHGKNEGYKNDEIRKITNKFNVKGKRYDEKQVIDNTEEFFANNLNKSLFDDDKIIIINRSTDKIINIIEELINKNIEDIIASEFMSSNPKVLKSDILANEALKIMRKNNISQVLIADKNNSLIGVVHILDIIKQGINDE